VKDLIDKVLSSIPRYLTQLGFALSAPKSFAEAQVQSMDDIFLNSVVFSGITIAIVIILSATRIPEGQDFWLFAALTGVQIGIGFSLISVGVFLGFRAVKGSARAPDVFALSWYFSSSMAIVYSVFQLGALGAFKILDRELYDSFFKAGLEGGLQMPDGLYESPSYWVFLVIFGLGSVFALVYIFACWGSFRKLNSVGRWKSFIAFMIFLLINVAGGAILLPMSVALR
jgi:hypothetical protein